MNCALDYDNFRSIHLMYQIPKFKQNMIHLLTLLFNLKLPETIQSMLSV